MLASLSTVGRLLIRPQTFHRFARLKQVHHDQIRCAGHAKWQNIKVQKMSNDLNKGKIISRYVLMVRKAIMSNNRVTDPKLNSKLAAVLNEAAKFSVPKATLERAIARTTNLKILSCNLEIQGPGKSTIIAKCETENVNLLRREIRKAIKKFDANLMPQDTLINMFYSQGLVRTESSLNDNRDIDQDSAEEAAINANAEEVFFEEADSDDQRLRKVWVFKTDEAGLDPCRGVLEGLGFKIISSDLELVPYRVIDFGPEVSEKTLELASILKQFDEVLDVYHNVNLEEN